MAIFGHFSPVFRGIFIRDEIIVVTGIFGQKRYCLAPKTEACPENNMRFENLDTSHIIERTHLLLNNKKGLSKSET